MAFARPAEDPGGTALTDLAIWRDADQKMCGG